MNNDLSSDSALLEEKVSPLLIGAEINTASVNSEGTLNLTDKIIQAKVNIVQNNNDSEINLIRPIIRDSWLRCYGKGLNLFDYNIGPILDKPAFDDLLHKKTLLIKAATPFIRKLASMCSNSMIMLTDENGVMLHIEMDKSRHFSWTVDRFHLIPGIVWAEETVGTLSTTLCEKYRIPIQMSGPEHYSETYHVYTASSAPITDINNNLTGTITLVSQDYITQNPHTLALIISITDAIERELRLISNKELINSFLAATDQGMVIIDNCGKITHANPKVSKILNPQIPDITGKMINDILGNPQCIKTLLETGKPVYNAEIFNKELNRSTFLNSAKPLLDHYGNKIGYTLELKEPGTFKKKVNTDSSLKIKFSFDNIIGKSTKLLQAISLAKKFAKLEYNILIQGESGTGKEMFAQAIHDKCCPDGPFIAINCAAIPKNLIESELFGYEAGAFTGADRQGRKGKFELADGGTLFLDEIGDMPLELQPALLRVLEEKQIMRIGGTSYKSVNFRLIAATNQVLPDLLEKKIFREDLYYRLGELQISIPPLRERGQDIIELANYFIAAISANQQLTPPSLHEATIYRLLKFSWPGNVRQLKSVIINAVNVAEHNVILPEDLPSIVNNSNDTPYHTQFSDPAEIINNNANDPSTLKDMEKMMIINAILQSNKNITEAARTLGISKSTLYKRIKEYELFNEIRSS